MSFLRRIFSSKVLPSWMILLLDTILVAVSVMVAFLLRYSFPELSETFRVQAWVTMGLCLVVNVLFSRLFHTYSNVLRLSSFADVMNIFVAVTLSYITCIILSVVVEFTLGESFAPPISVLLISYVVTFLLMALLRMVIKSIYDVFNEDHVRALNTFVSGIWAK